MTSPALQPPAGRVVLGRFQLLVAAPYDLPGVTAWWARDAILGREAIAYLVDPERAGATTAAANRSTLVTGTERFQRVLHAELEAEHGVIVCAPVSGQPLLDQLPLPEPRARSIVVDVARAIEAARLRGVVHGVLRPQCIWIAPDGTITVGGLGWEAALIGLQDDTAQARARRDARGLIELYGAALTGQAVHVRLTQADPYPTTPMPPEAAWREFPPDLRAFVRATLTGGDTGAVSPAEVASELRDPNSARRSTPLSLPVLVEPVSAHLERAAEVKPEPPGAPPEAHEEHDVAPAAPLPEADPVDWHSKTGPLHPGTNAIGLDDSTQEIPRYVDQERVAANEVDTFSALGSAVSVPPSAPITPSPAMAAPTDAAPESPREPAPDGVPQAAFDTVPLGDIAPEAGQGQPGAQAPEDVDAPTVAEPARPDESDADLTNHGEKRGRWWVVDSSIAELFPSRDDG